ncbi:hypothetical protein LCGC14_0779070 [marine sediment metagenome]|uniref:Uncharacterized protein n=1 Tax=marine sediment metagenome TaxID=412755 RepID=A0A0F9T367_9ZZZZ
MDRRQARRQVLDDVGAIELIRDGLEALAEQADGDGDPIFAGELRRFTDKVTDTLEKMYVWAGNI